jgi:hypothetical protein
MNDHGLGTPVPRMALRVAIAPVAAKLPAAPTRIPFTSIKSPSFLRRNWSPAFKEWSTRSIRDAFYASPVFPRLLNAEAIKQTVVRGVQDGLLAYVGKSGTEGLFPSISSAASIHQKLKFRMRRSLSRERMRSPIVMDRRSR